MKKRVCIIRSNPVLPDSRVEKEAWTLTKAGYDVHVLAWDRDDNYTEKNTFITVADEQIPITRLGYKATYGDGFKNIRPNLRFQFHMRKWLKKHKKEYDIIHACDLDTALFSKSAAKGKKFVFDVFDFRYGDPQSVLQKIIKMTQIRIINHADATIICTEERKKQIEKANPKRLAVIHNTPLRTLLHEKTESIIPNPSPKVKIAYVGILANKRLLLEIGNAIACDSNIELHIAGFGVHAEHFKQLSRQYDNIFYYGRIPYDKTLALESECDIMTAIYDPAVENNRFAAPNKFYESLMLGKPIIMVRGTGMSDVVEKNSIGELIDFDEEGFKTGVKRLINRRDEWETMSTKMKKLYEDQFSWEKMQDRLTALYSEL